MTKASYRRKSLFWLTVPEGQESIVVGSHGGTGQAWRHRTGQDRHGSRSKRQRVNWEWHEAFNLRACPQWHAFHNKAEPPKLP